MSSRLIQVLLALSLLLNTFVLMGFVYRSWIEPPPFERHAPPPPGQRPSALETMTHDLNLDDGQRQGLRGVFEQYAASRRDRLREIQKLREQLARMHQILAERLAAPPVGRAPGGGAGPGPARPPQ